MILGVLMADTTLNTRSGISLSGLFRTVGESLFAGLCAMGEARSRSRQLNFYASLSDEELKERGLTRDGIVQHVFAGSIWR